MALKMTSRSFYSGLTDGERERLQVFLGGIEKNRPRMTLICPNYGSKDLISTILDQSLNRT